MNFDELLATANNYYQANKFLAIAMGICVLIFAFLKPKPFFKLLAFLLIAAGLFWAVSLLMDTTRVGTQMKEKAATRTEKALE